MKFFSILRELFESDSFIFMSIGLVFAIILSIKMSNSRRIIIALISSFGLYAICELFSNIHTSYLFEMILLFLGTIAIGGIIGFLISVVIVKVRKMV